MLLHITGPFPVGTRVRVEIPEFNLQGGAGELYPHLGTGDVVLPVKEDKKKGVAVDDPATQRDLEDERLALISLDKRFRWTDPETHKQKWVSKLTIPWALLKKIK